METIDKRQAVMLFESVKQLCNEIVNSHPETQIKGRIESLAFEIGHHPYILNPHLYK